MYIFVGSWEFFFSHGRVKLLSIEVDIYFNSSGELLYLPIQIQYTCFVRNNCAIRGIRPTKQPLFIIESSSLIPFAYVFVLNSPCTWLMRILTFNAMVNNVMWPFHANIHRPETYTRISYSNYSIIASRGATELK